MRNRRRFGIAFAAAVSAFFVALATGQAQESRFFRIATGGQSGTYFPVGLLIAQAISDMPAGPNCAEPRCGVPGLVGVAQISNGSVANMAALQAREVEAALVQADVAHWAFEAKEIYQGKPRHDRVRFLANLYPEAMHVVARRQSGIDTLAALKGRKVALDEPGSGTLIHARNLLTAYSLREADLQGVYVKADLAVPQLIEGRLDAFFMVAGWPAKPVLDALASGHARLLPIDVDPAAGPLKSNPFLTKGEIPAHAYVGIPAVPSLMVGAQLVARADLPDDLVEAVLTALWSERGQSILRRGHPRAADIRFEAALEGRSLPLHPGADRFYRDRGLRPD